jgi:DNA modification methylase
MSNVSTDIEIVGGPENAKYGMYIDDSRRFKEILSRQFPDAVEATLVDVTVTSPPYADKKNYEADEEAQIGFGQSYDEYLEDLRSVYRQVYDVTKDTGTLWLTVNSIKKNKRMVNIPFDIADICENL